MNEARLQETWYGGRKPGLLLSALERVYAEVSAARRQKIQPAQDLLEKPIMVVGNITAGGTGKTPVVIRLVELLRAQGIAVAVVSRGYGRQGSDPVRVRATTRAEVAGDEPALIARRCGVEVFVDSDREAACRAAFAAGHDVVIADDGLQRAQLPRVMELCVVDATRGFGNGRLLPAGPLREPLERLASVDWVLLNGEGRLPEVPQPPQHPTVPVHLVAEAFRQLGSDETLAPEDAAARFTGGVSAVAGMGNPERFFTTLDALGVNVLDRRPFPDHHRFGREDFAKLGRPLVMTEKDAVKCDDLGLENSWALGVSAQLPPTWESAWLRTVEKLLSNN